MTGPAAALRDAATFCEPRIPTSARLPRGGKRDAEAIDCAQATSLQQHQHMRGVTYILKLPAPLALLRVGFFTASVIIFPLFNNSYIYLEQLTS